MPSQATTVDAYLAELPEDRRAALSAVRAVILKNLPKRVSEGMQYGMIGYFVPHDIYPAGYHCDSKQPLPFASLASQKNHMALYLMSIYGDESEEAWLREAWTATGNRLDMGKSCIRFKKIEHVPLEVVGQVFARASVADYIARYETTLKPPSGGASKRSAAGPAAVSAPEEKRGRPARSSGRSAAATKKSATRGAASASAAVTAKTNQTPKKTDTTG